MSIHKVWPTVFYVGEVKDHDKIVEAFTPFVRKEDHYFESNWAFCDSLSSIFHERNREMPWHVFDEAIRPNFEEYLNQLNPMVPYSTYTAQSWVNIYKQGGFQEVHDHAGPSISFSCSYFFHKPEQDESAGLLVFKNNNSQLISSQGIDLIFNEKQHNMFIPPVKSGTIVFFPSWVPHFTTPNQSEERRVTFSANFTVQPQISQT